MTFGRTGKSFWYSDRGFYYCGYTKRYEFNRGTKLYSKSSTWYCTFTRCSSGYVEETGMEDESLN